MTDNDYSLRLAHVLRTFGLDSYSPHTRPIIVPNYGREQLAGLFAELGYTRGVEIGVWKGEYSEVLLRANEQLRLWSVDPWKVEAFPPKMRGYPDTQAAFDANYKETKKRLKEFGARSIILRTYSTQTAQQFEDGSLDFVYIDGNHDFQNCTNDICNWTPKVRIGGIISGHDYSRQPLKYGMQVKQVVEAYTAAYGITPWFVLGRQEKGIPGEIRDDARSWFWLKKG
jgi:hypothetical protein